jgi:hypothetical protein
MDLRGHGGIGRRSGLKIRRSQDCGGSSPPAPIAERACGATIPARECHQRPTVPQARRTLPMGASRAAAMQPPTPERAPLRPDPWFGGRLKGDTSPPRGTRLRCGLLLQSWRGPRPAPRRLKDPMRSPPMASLSRIARLQQSCWERVEDLAFWKERYLRLFELATSAGDAPQGPCLVAGRDTPTP